MRKITRSYRLRIYPNGAQRRLRDRWFGASRWLWNTALEIRTEAYQQCGLTLTGIDISRWLTQWKQTQGHEWLALVPATCQYALHDLTTRLTREFDLIFIEDLNVKALSRGRNARSIQDASFGEIRRQLTYKADWHSKILIEVNRWYASSKICSNCQHKLDELRLDVREWTCPKCKAFHDRDINAARNVLTEGLRQLAGRDDRDLRVDARGASAEEILWEVLAYEARSGQCNRACLEQGTLH